MTRQSDPTSIRIGAWRRLLSEESGATAVEYGLMAALISLAIIGAVTTMGQAISTVLFGNVASSLANMSK